MTEPVDARARLTVVVQYLILIISGTLARALIDNPTTTSSSSIHL